VLVYWLQKNLVEPKKACDFIGLLKSNSLVRMVREKVKILCTCWST